MKTKNSNILVIASATAKLGREADVRKALDEFAGPTKRQPGCLQFGLYQAAGTSSAFVVLEKWASEADHDRQLQSAHVQRLMSRLADIVAAPPSIVLYHILDESA